MVGSNRQYDQMLSAVKVRAALRNPADIAGKAGILWNGTALEAVSLGIPVEIRWEDLEITPKLELWHNLGLLTYLADADGTEPEGTFLSLCDFPDGGMVRGTSFDRMNDAVIQRIGRHTPEEIRAAVRKLGGEEVPGKADMSFRFFFLPKLPLLLNLWLADEDFPASGKVLPDASARHTLKVEASGVVTQVLLQLLEKVLTQK